MSYKNLYQAAYDDAIFRNAYFAHENTPNEWDFEPDVYVETIVCSIYLGYTIGKYGVNGSEAIVKECKFLGE